MDQNHHPFDAKLVNLSESSGLTRNGPLNGLRDQSDAGMAMIPDLISLSTPFFVNSTQDLLNSTKNSIIYLERVECLEWITQWDDSNQMEFVQQLIDQMTQPQHSRINEHLKRLLQRDFISLFSSEYFHP